MYSTWWLNPPTSRGGSRDLFSQCATRMLGIRVSKSWWKCRLFWLKLCNSQDSSPNNLFHITNIHYLTYLMTEYYFIIILQFEFAISTISKLWRKIINNLLSFCVWEQIIKHSLPCKVLTIFICNEEVYISYYKSIYFL